MTTATQNAGVITLAELHDSPEFLLLTSKQKMWVDAFLSTGDANGATRTAYGDAQPDSYVAMLTGKLQDSPHIRAVLNLFYGRSPKQAFLFDLERAIAREKGAPRIAAMQLYARLTLRDESKNPDPAETTERIMIQNGGRFRITATRIGDVESTESR